MMLGLVLMAVMIFVVARPFLVARGVSASAESSPGVTLLAEREAVLNALHDLDFDYTLNKIPTENYFTQRAQLVARGAEILRQLDAVAPSEAGPLPKLAETEPTIEAAIAARRKTVERIPTLACPYCHTTISATDKFCGHCGHALAAVCAHCGQALESADRFCANCGMAVAVKEMRDET